MADPAQQPRRELDPAEVSRRLKAARWLAGGVDVHGRPVAMSAQELAEHEPLVRNRITANAISEIEQLIRPAREMELDVIARALGLPEAWFSEPLRADRQVTTLLHLTDVHFIERAVTERIQPLQRTVASLSELLVADLQTRNVEVSPDVKRVIETIRTAGSHQPKVPGEPEVRDDPRH